MPFASARARKLSRHWSKPGGAAANAARGCASRAPAPRPACSSARRVGDIRRIRLFHRDSLPAGEADAAEVNAPLELAHPAADLWRFWTASAAPWPAPWRRARPSAAAPAPGRDGGICRAGRRRAGSASTAAPGRASGCGVFLMAPIALQIADDDADGLRGQQRHPGEIGARQARIGPQHGQHRELRRGDAEIGQRAVPSSAGSRPGPAAADRRGSPVRRACPGPAAAGGRRREPEARRGFFRRGADFVAALDFRRFRVFRTGRDFAALDLAHDIRALIINQSTDNMR